MPNARQALFPYGMARNPDGSWTFFNRNYKPVGVTSDEWPSGMTRVTKFR